MEGSSASLKDIFTSSPASKLAVGSQRQRPTKYMANITRAELYEHYCHWHFCNSEGSAASASTFRRVWLANWKGILRVRHKTQHSRCTECSRISTLLRRADTEDEKATLFATHEAHLNTIFADRSTDDRASQLSAQSCKLGCTLSGRLLKIDIDGMDQSKYKCPRNYEAPFK